MHTNSHVYVHSYACTHISPQVDVDGWMSRVYLLLNTCYVVLAHLFLVSSRKYRMLVNVLLKVMFNRTILILWRRGATTVFVKTAITVVTPPVVFHSFPPTCYTCLPQ